MNLRRSLTKQILLLGRSSSRQQFGLRAVARDGHGLARARQGNVEQAFLGRQGFVARRLVGAVDRARERDDPLVRGSSPGGRAGS